MSEERAETWGGALKENVVWFLFAVLLAAGSSYINSRTTTVRIQADIENLQRRVQNIENQTKENSQEVSEIREDLVRLESKIDQLLTAQGIQPLQQQNNSDQ